MENMDLFFAMSSDLKQQRENVSSYTMKEMCLEVQKKEKTKVHVLLSKKNTYNCNLLRY